MRTFKSWLAAGSLALAAIAVCELLLQVAAFASFEIRRVLAAPLDQRPLIGDSQLGVRGNPLNPDHDRRGYRNPRNLERAAIVTLGDSQTYGASVAQEEAWPHQLAALVGVSVYNYALGLYSSAHNLLQIDEALSLEPQLIYVGLYFGNDLQDAFQLSRTNREIAALVPPDLVETIEDLELEKPLGAEVVELFAAEGMDGPSEPTSAARRFVSRYSKLYGLARALRHRLAARPTVSALLATDFETAVSGLTPRKRRYASIYEGPDWRTILTSAYRGQMLNLEDPRIRAGMEIIKSSLIEMEARSRAAGVRLVVVLIPTKERVFWPRVDHPEQHTGLRSLVGNERMIHGELTGFLDQRGLEYVDVLESLRVGAVQPYFENADGHPNAAGHAIIAEAVARDWLSRRMDLPAPPAS
jgi:lysophospholipase L1-like esterase